MCKAINSKMHNSNQPQNDHHKARKCKESLRHGASIANLGELAYAQYICMLSIGKMANSIYGYPREVVLDLCNGAVSEKMPQIF